MTWQDHVLSSVKVRFSPRNGKTFVEADADVAAASQGEKSNLDLCNDNATVASIEQGNGNVDEGHCSLSPSNINPNSQIANGKPNKRGRKGKDMTTKECVKREKKLGYGTCATSKEDSGNFAEKQINGSNGNSLIMDKYRNRSKNAKRGTRSTEPRPENALAVSDRTEILDPGGKNKVSFLPISLGKKQGIYEDIHLKTTGKICQKINSQCEENFYTRSKRRKVDPTSINMLGKISMVRKQTDEDTIPQSPLMSMIMAADKRTFVLMKKTTKSTRKIKSALNLKCDVGSRYNQRTKVSSNGMLKDGLVEDNQVQEGYDNTANKIKSLSKSKSLEEVQGSADIKVLDDLSGEKLLGTQRVALQKCEALAHKIECSFCRSSEDSEASGEMVHYCNGRPVSVYHNGGSKIINSHRNCAEWAPNVYFEDDTAINLEAELARSRRIKCCCCGYKGAVLGCYEKSCCKSFHFPCAKLIPQCQWDTDNFVMLCPLHAASKLPNDNPGSQESRKKCISKTKLQSQLNQVTMKNDIRTRYSWHSPQNKLVSVALLLELEKSVKKWDSSVTNVIASTDENGACRWTLKYLMGILEGKWILNIDWVKSFMKAMKPVDEEQYEITIDVHGMMCGPRIGRWRVLNKPMLFDGLQFYLMGGFLSSYKGYLQDLIPAAGGTILHGKPISRDQGALLSGLSASSTFIIYSLELPDKCDPSKKDMILNSRQS